MKLSLELPQKILFGTASNYRYLRLIIRVCVVAVVFMQMVPLSPYLPQAHADDSWRFAISQANEQGLVFGKDFIFSFGPYGFLFTRLYHPATDVFMILGSVFFAACLSVLILFLTRTSPIIWQLMLVFFLGFGFIPEEAMFYLYLLLLSLYTFRIIQPDGSMQISTSRQKLFYILSFLPVGLLLLMKGNLTIMALGVVFLCLIATWIYKLRNLSLWVLLTVVSSTIVFWLIIDQPFSALWNYFMNTFFIINGYSEAMAKGEPFSEIVVYIAASVAILLLCLNYKKAGIRSKLFLVFSIALILFLVFKSSFVRFDWNHGRIAPASILLVALFLHVAIRDKYLPHVFVLTLFAWAFSHRHYEGLNPFRHEPIVNEFVKGMIMRSNGQLSRNYNDSLRQISEKHPLPLLKGTTDIYSFEQMILFASGNRWSPRPVIQSYSVYTAELAKINESYLTGNNSPDNIVFKMQAVDGRYPSLDDGLSWPTIINNYSPVSMGEEFLILEKKREKNITPHREKIYCANHRLNEDIFLPDTAGVLFAEIDLRQNIIGQLVSIAYRPQRLAIYTQFENGGERKDRFIATMAKAGFVISPLVEDNNDFNLLIKSGHLKEKTIRSFRISTDSYGNKIKLWHDQFHVCVSRVVFDK